MVSAIVNALPSVPRQFFRKVFSPGGFYAPADRLKLATHDSLKAMTFAFEMGVIWRFSCAQCQYYILQYRQRPRLSLARLGIGQQLVPAHGAAWARPRSLHLSLNPASCIRPLGQWWFDPIVVMMVMVFSV